MQYAIQMTRFMLLRQTPCVRTVPLVSRFAAYPWRELQQKLSCLKLREKNPPLKLKSRSIAHFGVKEAVLPFNMFQEVDPV